MWRKGDFGPQTFFRSVISDMMINSLLRTSYVAMLLMLDVMYDTGLQCSFVSNTISSVVFYILTG